MIIKVVDRFGLGTILKMDGYGSADIEKTKSIIKQQFHDAASLLLDTIKGDTLPSTIDIKLAQQRNDETLLTRIAALDVGASTTDNLVFIVYETEFRRILDQPEKEMDGLRECVFHEMGHAADIEMLKQGNLTINCLNQKISNYYANAFNNIANLDKSGKLIIVVAHLNSFRAEGIALLSEKLASTPNISKAKIAQDLDSFKTVFRLLLAISMHSSPGKQLTQQSRLGLEYVKSKIYDISASLILLVLRNQKTIDDVSWEKITNAPINPSTKELGAILKQAFQLSLTEYIHGLINITKEEDDNPTLNSLLQFCNILNDVPSEYNAESIDVFTELSVNEKLSAKTFNRTLRDIMGCKMSDDELRDAYNGHSNNNANSNTKIDTMVALLINRLSDYPQNSEKGEVIRWALTYFFDDKDLIDDNIPVMGYIDDMVILDMAQKLI